MSESPHIRVSVAERERALVELSQHFSNGTLTIAEFDQRSALAIRAGTRAQMAVLFTDLPAAPTTPPEPVDGALVRSAVRAGAVLVLSVVFWLTFGDAIWLMLLTGVPVIVLMRRRGR